MGEDINELHNEWRAIVLNKLNSLETGQLVLHKEISDIKTSFVHNSQLNALQQLHTDQLQALTTKVEVIESFKAKVVGMIIAINAIAVLVGWIITSFVRLPK